MKLKALISMLVFGVVSTQADDKFTCPITKPTPVAFNKTGTFAFAGHQGELFGTEKLFTLFPGNWHTVQKSERGYRVPKIVWGTVTFDLKQEVSSSLTITGRRLDAASEPLQSGGANTAYIDEATRFGPVPKDMRTPLDKIDKNQFFITSEFYVPTLGCWEVTGHFHGTDLTIVVDLK